MKELITNQTDFGLLRYFQKWLK